MNDRQSDTKERPYRGADIDPSTRPGVPRDAKPHPLSGTHWTVPVQQPLERANAARPERLRDTSTFGTALPPRGVSGLVRRLAYRIPDHLVSHWLLLLAADRIDAVESLPRTLLRRSIGSSSLTAALWRRR